MYDYRKKILLLLLIITLLFSLFTVYIHSTGGLSVSAKSATLYEPTTNTFLYSKNANARLPMASTTKIMTALVAIECSDVNKQVVVNDNAIGVEGSSIYIEKSECFTMLDLIYALMLQSANDAAAAIAYEIAGGIDEFADLMNEKAKEIGLKNTNFTNPHGLDNEMHYTTAQDLARLGAYALSNEIFKNVVSTHKKEITSSAKTRLLVNHNKLLNLYDGAIGVKTGFTKRSGRSLVGAAEKDGITLISVTINAPDDWNDHERMLDYGYGILERRNLATYEQFCYKVPVVNSEQQYVTVKNTDELFVILKKHDNITINVVLPRYITAPLNAGDQVGYVSFCNNSTEIGRVPLRTDFDLTEIKRSFPLF